MFQTVRKTVLKGLLLASLMAAVALPLSSALAFNSDPNTLDIDGSTTVYPVVLASQTQFPIQFPGTTMNVTSTGSGHGQAYILSGQVDIAMSSSNCSDGNAGTNGANAAIYTCSQLTDTLIGRDGITIVVNKNSCMAAASNPDITRNQISSIYMGAITDWHTIFSNCASGSTILPRARIIGSGTRASLIDILKARTPALTDAGEQATINAVAAPYNVRFEGNPEMESAIGSDTTGRQIGYVGLAFLDPNLKALTVEGVVSSDTNVSNGTYPLGRNLHLYTAPTSGNNKQRIADYITWILSVGGQSIVDNYGYVKVGVSAPNWDVNLDHRASVTDLTTIGAKWQQVGPASGDAAFPKVRGWIRADVNFDGKVTVTDLTTVGGHWQQSW
jgi:phosphate transport system substrate-binding protein